MPKIKQVDFITALLLFFIFFLAILFSYLVKINKHVDEYTTYHDHTVELKFLDKSFDNFLLKKSTFINYDFINSKIVSFENNFNFLDSKNAHKLYGKEYASILNNIQVSFDEKQKYIEHFKSNHASLLNSIHYVFDLNEAIKKSSSFNEQTKQIATKQTLLLMKYYVNTYTNKERMQKNLKFLNQVLQEDQKEIILKLFIINVGKNIKRIEKSYSLKNMTYEKSSLFENINQLHIFLDKNHTEKVFIEKIITVIFFFIALIILFILIIMHRRSLRVQHELLGFKSAVENSDNSIVITDAEKNITYVNDIFEKETGYIRDEVLGQNPRVLKSGKMPQSVYDELNKKLDMGQKWEGEFINVRKDKSFYYEKASITPIYVNNELKHYLAIKLNITDYIEQKQEVEFLALHDALTKLPNRTSIENSIERKMEIAKRNKSKITILFVDMDRFKIINDTLGHDIGDDLLIETAKRLKESIRETDIVARIGGDEFLVVLETLDDEHHAGKVCEKIIKNFNKPLQTKSHQLNITLSIGVSIFPDDGVDYQTLLKHADIAMYQAKSAGKNTFRYYQKELSLEVLERLNIEQSFNNALVNNEFYLMYQPQYTLADKKIVGLEALVRWENNSLGYITPDKFIPIAEDTGFILELGVFIFEQACKDFLTFKQYSDDLKTISINISAVQLYQKTFIDNITSIVNEIGINPKSIILEITETYIMKNVSYSMKILNELRKAGFNVSIDDFGTGHSSLSYLKKFPINELKIDKSFIDGIPSDQNDIAITQVIIGLSKNLDYINVAEGIENEKQEEFLMNHSCRIGQGFYFCKPKKKNDLVEFINSYSV